MQHGLSVIIHNHIESYISSVSSVLEENEAENSLLLGLLGRVQCDSSPSSLLLAEIKWSDTTIGAAFYSGKNLILSRDVEAAIEPLIANLTTRQMNVPGVVGPAEVVEAFHTSWAHARQCRAMLSMEQGIYQLTRIVCPATVPGRMRSMTERDIDLIAEWLQSFHVEAVPQEVVTREEAQRSAETRPHGGMTFLWDLDGTCVAMASLARPTRRGITINGVYTPPQYRRHGYATALVAAVSAEGLSRGKEFCTLYTDLLNPTSNSIYQKIGYVWVSRSRYYLFEYQ
jgi:predicted GNAT family acetyltransferase